MSGNPYRALPAVHEVLSRPEFAALAGPAELADAVRDELAAARRAIRDGKSWTPESLLDGVRGRLERAAGRRFRRVINATGIILHTNLGRSLLADEAAQAAHDAVTGATNLELDLATGKRTSRQRSVRELLIKLTGAEAATAVNNCAAATMLALRSLAAGREVVVSRGQLVEIGGSYRLPEVMAAGGVTLREVGTTNITRAADYEAAITDRTAALMRVHTSNYRVVGFTKSASPGELVAIGRRHGVPVIDDAGSGAMIDLAEYGLPGEPVIPQRVAAGADLVLFSGDKLLGGPQAGLLVGRAELIRAAEADPLMRAFRCDKMTLAALEATLQLYRDGRAADIPTVRMIAAGEPELRERAERIAAAVPGSRVGRVRSYVGGGSVPGRALPSAAVSLPVGDEAEVARRLRLGTPAVLSRVRRGRVWLDVRTVLPSQEGALTERVREASR